MPKELTNEFKLGEFIANRSLNTLVRAESSISVEPKVMEVLYYLASRANQVISRQQLMDNLWQSQVSDGAVSRVVGLLRKALEDNSESPLYIQTVAKKGYRLIAEVESISGQQEQASLSSLTVNFKSIITIGVLLAVALLIALNWSAKIEQSKTGLIISQPQFNQLTSEQGFEYDANLSFDEKWLIYRHRNNLKDKHNLYLKILDSQQSNQQVIQLTNSAKDDRAPTFSPDKRQILFTRKAMNDCSLMLLSLDENGQPLEEKQIYQCGAFDHYSNLVWSKDAKSIYFTDRASAEVPYQIHKLNLATKRVEKMTSGLDNYYGDNELSLSPSGKYLAFFRNKYWGNNQVYILELETGEEKKLLELGFLAWNISWTADEKHLLYSDNRNGGMLKLIDINDASVETIYYSSQSINSPELSASGSSIIYSTETADVDLWKISIDDLKQNKKPIKQSASSSRLDGQPALTKGGEKLLFLSDRNSVTQLWLQDKDGMRVMDSVKNESRIDEYSWHPDGKQVLVAHSDKTIYLLDTEKNTSLLIDLGDKKAAYPQFSNDGKTIYFTSDSSGDWQLWSYQLASVEAGNSQAMNQLTETGGYRVKVGDDDNLYFTKYRQTGIWRLDLLTKKEEVIASESIRSSNFAVCRNSIIYEVDNKQSQLWQIDLSSQSKHLLLTTPNSAKFKFDVIDDCKKLVFSQWENIESDVMMMKM